MKILKWFSLGLSSLLFFAFLYFYFVFLAQPGAISSRDEIKDQKWHTVPLKSQSSCSDGSAYNLLTRKGTSDNLIIHFSGGGACWDGISCANPLTLSKLLNPWKPDELRSFYFPEVMRIFPKFLGGFLDYQDESNPFKDWNVVYLPYCTGDMHIGNVKQSYTFEKRDFQISHLGRTNTEAAIEWLKANYPSANKIMISGESAGAYAAAFWAPKVSSLFPDQQIYQLSDGALIQSNRWNEILDTVWQSDSKNFLKFEIEKDIYENTLLNRLDSLKGQIKHLHANSIYDGVLTKFSAALNHSPTNDRGYIDNWSRDMLQSVNTLASSAIDYHYFLSDCKYDSLKHNTPHVLSMPQNQNACESEGVTFKEWLKRSVIDDEDLSLGRAFLAH